MLQTLEERTKLMKVYNYIRLFCKIPWIEKKLITRGICVALFCRLILYMLPFKYFIFFFGSNGTSESSIIENSNLNLANRNLRRINRVLPWTNKCIIKSPILKSFLSCFNIKSEIVLSILKVNNGIQAHAYIKLKEDMFFFRIPQYYDICTINSEIIYKI